MSMLLALLVVLGALTQPELARAQTSSIPSTETIAHDERGNVSGITRDGQTATYQYDLLDRLKAETGPSTQGITYDANGNRTGDASSTYTVAPNSNRLNNRRNASVIYDAAGNVRLERVLFNGAAVNRTLSYNAANQLSEVRVAGTVSSYLYDHRGLRGRKTLSNPPAGVPAITLYTHDPNGHLFKEIAGSGPNAGQALVTYLWQDDVPAAIVLGPYTPGNPSGQDKLLYLEVDHLNTPRIARDQQKRVVWRWDSDAFGNTAPNEDPDGIKTTINLRFPGQYFDAESGLHYNWHRYYDPQVGRYTQPDPIGVAGGSNPYAYVGGNPLSFIDPDGLRCTYSQGGRTLTCVNDTTNVIYLSCSGYAGTGEGRNNPDAEEQSGVGPLPRGTYTVGPAFRHPHAGPGTRRLTPAPSNNMHNRSGFLIHGDNARNDASNGCIIAPPDCRRAVPPGETLTVVR